MTAGLTVIVPTYNERDNVAELVRRLGDAAAGGLPGRTVEVLFVDDSTDGTDDEVRRVARTAPLRVRVVHRFERSGGLSGAVVAGLREAAHDLCIVMDGDLQHPPELLPSLVTRHAGGGTDAVIASRRVGSGDSSGLGTALRFGVSHGATWLSKALFPVKLAGASDPMTGFFLVDRSRISLDRLRPQGFKILLEILVKSDLRIAEVPLAFARRAHGESKASARQGLAFVAHVLRLRFSTLFGRR